MAYRRKIDERHTVGLSGFQRFEIDPSWPFEKRRLGNFTNLRELSRRARSAQTRPLQNIEISSIDRGETCKNFEKTISKRGRSRRTIRTYLIALPDSSIFIERNMSQAG